LAIAKVQYAMGFHGFHGEKGEWEWESMGNRFQDLLQPLSEPRFMALWPGFMDECGSVDVQILSCRALKGRKWLLSVA